ncbi:MAG: NAD+ synthase [Thiomonas sp. 13-66-29]|uniref:Glutamine-dependent NAD(+) synthetase n=1 Tax=Thiomonas delicata TaxID=364030 RepID=A0A238D7Y0_THIDL|nr:NAD+ synthase [Thiomonas delicata]OZB61394.1 MAG: NAD+ synthase [Thiomonas sp. 13-66-29]SBP89244.1 putative glutamine-dependent NAD(+) synthetase [Thiomonas delicata]
MSIPIAIAQFNGTVGDLAGNSRAMAAMAAQAYAQGARVLLTPELSLTGYPPEDLLLRPAFLRATEEALHQLAQSLAQYPDLAVVVGHPHVPGERADVRTASTQQPLRWNAASVLRGGRVEATYGKLELPNYQVFDERRYFARAGEPCVFEAGGLRIGINICEDAWFAEAPRRARAAGAQVLLVLNASPFHLGKSQAREDIMRRRCLETGMALVFAHGVGGQDELVFDGGSFVMDAQGQVLARAPQFEECLLVAGFDAHGAPQAGLRAEIQPLPAQAWDALVTGTRDYVNKNGFPGVLIGLSGGVDSALVLAVAVDALGPERVRTVMMPSPYTADISWLDAREMAQGLGVRHDELSIRPMFDAFRTSLDPLLTAREGDTTEENLQSRIRGTLLMALSNNTGWMVLTTGNKSEMATGYATLYGDMAGGFAVIKDVRKTLVWELARWRNAQALLRGKPAVIPARIITRAPSAELRPDQTDQDSLPPYPVLDAILERYMENDQSPEELLAAGLDPAAVAQVLRLIKLNEYKRRQAPPGVRITHRAFGRDWRYPITSRWLEGVEIKPSAAQGQG